MTNKFNKFISIIMILNILVGMFSACSNEPADNDEQSGEVSLSESSNEVSVEASDVSADNESNDESADASNDVSNASDASSEASEAHIHTFEVAESVDPTCTEQGYTISRCAECGEENREDVPALGHDEGKWVVKSTVSTTCTGVEHLLCTRCDELLDEKVIPMLPNDESDDVSDNASDESSEEASEHVHYDYAIKTVVDPTCTEPGYTHYECSCGTDKKYDYVDALGHSYGDWKVTKEATTTAEGKKEKVCSRCGYKVTESIPMIENDESSDISSESSDPYDVIATSENMHLVEERILYYINQYRVSEGSCEMTMLTGKARAFARGRAVQLTTNYAHDTEDIRSLATELEFGVYVPEYPESYFDFETEEVVYTGNMIPAYYQPAGSEAIGKTNWPNPKVDEIAKDMAGAWYRSEGHWLYIGSNDNSYLAVGVALRYDEGWYFCLLASCTNEYD